MAGKNIINVSTPSLKVTANVTRDLSQYYSGLAKDWANKIGSTVDGEEYSSKYYALQSKQFATEAEQTSDQAQIEITNLKNEAVTEVEAIRDGAISEVTTASNTAIDNIDTVGTAQVGAVEQAGADVLTDITSQGNTIIQEATAQADRAEAAAEEAESAVNNISISTLNDVILVNLQDKQALVYNSETQKWENGQGGGGSGLELGDLVQKDHVLTFEESKGLALLGTYVYKEAVQGTRYGYPEFYNKYLEYYKGATTIKSIYNNVSLVGSPTIDNGVVSGFSRSDYCDVTDFNPQQHFEMVFKFKLDTLGVAHRIFGSKQNFRSGFLGTTTNNNLQVGFSTNGTAWDLTGQGTTILSANTWYYTKTVWDNTSYKVYLSQTNEFTNTPEINITSTTLLYNSWDLILGTTFDFSNFLQGSIDLKESYININGERFWNGTVTAKQSSNGLLFYDIADKDIFDNLYEQTGKAWCYGIDTANERIFLPRNDYIFYNGSDTTKVGDSIEAGLPNIVGMFKNLATTFAGTMGSANGAFQVNAVSGDKVHKSGNNTESGETDGISFDASRSSSIYGNSDTVKMNGVQMLTYMVVGNVTNEMAQTDVIEIATTENDTMPLYYNFYSPEDMTTNGVYVNASLGSYLSGDVYTTVYNDFVNKLGQPFCAGTVKSYGDSDITDYDVVVNQDDMTFRLPLLNGSEDLIDYNSNNTTYPLNEEFTVPKNGIVIVDGAIGSGYGWLGLYVNNVTVDAVSVASNTESMALQAIVVRNDKVKVNSDGTFDPTTTCTFYPAKGNGSLYFKLTNAVQNPSILDVAGVMSAVNDKLDRDCTNASDVGTEFIAHQAMPSDRYIDLTLLASGSTYTAPADGWYYAKGKSTSTTGQLWLINKSSSFSSELNPTNTINGAIYIPVKKGATVELTYAGFTVYIIRFIYAEGSK